MTKDLTVYQSKNLDRFHQQGGDKPVSFITEQEVYRMVDCAKKMRDGERNELLLTLLFQGALRISEAVKLQIQDKGKVDDTTILAILGKGKKPRLVAIPDKLSYHMGDFAQRNGLKPDDRFFPITRQRAWQIVKECAVCAGIDRRIYCHLFRHGGAIARLKRTGNPKSLQIHLGHSDMKMTMRYLSTLQVTESLETEAKVEFER